jgi:electron transport complex protein RnfD
MGLYQYGAPALGVIALSVSCAMLWELIMNRVMKHPLSIIDGNAAVIGLLFAMLLPATTPWWAVVVGTFAAMIVGKHIYGGIGCNPLNPVMVAVAMMALSWQDLLDFNQALVNYDFGFNMVFPLSAVKAFGAAALDNYGALDLLLGKQAGGLGSAFGLGLIIGGVYLIIRGHIRWEICLSFLVGIFLTALLFKLSDPLKYGGPVFHLLTGYTLIAAFFLVTEDSSSPVNILPMLIYGFAGGFLTVLIRNIGIFADGTVFAILLINIANPLIDKIRPKALGREIQHA